MKKIKRSGDINLIEVKELRGKIISHNGSYCLARGEATGSEHRIVCDNASDMILAQDDGGNVFIQLKSSAKLMHTHDHQTITVDPGTYIVVPEREIDHFMEIERKVQD